jgi:hypothetical protein
VDAQDVERLAGLEVAALVEDAVVGQVMLELRGDDLAAVQHGDRVARPDVIPIEITHDGGDVAGPGLRQLRGQPGQRLPGRLREGLPQGEVLDRVAGEHHLGEDDDVCARLPRTTGPVGDERRVPVQIPDGGIDLCHPDAKLSHARHPRTVFAFGAKS